MSCNHIWRGSYEPFPISILDKEKLSWKILEAGIHGRYIKEDEWFFANQLIAEGTAKKCNQCNKAVFTI
jgi:hypothetical protein